MRFLKSGDEKLVSNLERPKATPAGNQVSTPWVSSGLYTVVSLLFYSTKPKEEETNKYLFKFVYLN